MKDFDQCKTLEEAKDKVKKLEIYFTKDLEECETSKSKLNDCKISEELKFYLTNNWNTRINVLTRFLNAIEYGLP